MCIFTYKYIIFVRHKQEFLIFLLVANVKVFYTSLPYKYNKSVSINT